MTTEGDETIAALLQSMEQARTGGRYAEALASLEQLPAEVRGEFQVLAREADLHGQLGDHDREIGLYDQLVAAWPDVPSLWASKAHSLKTVGRTDEAIAAARQALAIQPGYGKAWWVLSDLKTYRFSDEDVAAMEQALAAAVEPADKLHLHFALGQALLDRGQPGQSFAHIAAGNALRAASIPADATRVTTRVNRRIECLTAEFFAERAGGGCDSDAPIFIVGLPRSGTTVVEQILASHPDIEATRELGLIPTLQVEVVRGDRFAGGNLMGKLAALTEVQRRDLGQAYLDRAADFRRTDKPRFIDKLPTNWLNIGLIHLILPNARIIDARRHPMAAGFANFRQNYGSGAPWAYSLETLGRYYQDYLRMMRHFDTVLPGRVHRVVNEQLIADFEPEVRRLLDHVGVAFEPACLEFHRSDRPVRSASAEQVRRPINRDGVDQWRAFEPWLDPLKQALGPALEDWR